MRDTLQLLVVWSSMETGIDNAAQDLLLGSDLIYMDETPVQVLKGTNR